MAERRGPGEDGFARITPAPVSLGQEPRGAPANAGHRNSLPAALVVAGVVLLLGLGAGVFLWLGQRHPPPSAGVAPAPAPQPANQKPTVPSADQALARRERAQELGAQLTAKRGQLAERAAGRWAGAEADAIEQLAAAGAQRFASHDYLGAANAYTQAIAAAENLLGRVDAVLAQALADGRQALAAGNPQEAAAAFALALAIDADNAAAHQGAAQAAVRDQVLARMRAGLAREQAGQLQSAREQYAEAQQLDPAYAPAQAALARVAAALAQQRFRANVSAGLAALAEENYAAARAAFRSAKKIRPDAAAVHDGLARAAAGLQRQAIAAQRQAAENAEAAENWPAAVAAYGRILAIDASLAFAQAGREHAAARAVVAQRLGYHLDHPARLAAEQVRSSVAALLERARAVGEAGPKLNTAIAELSRLLAAAGEPVPVQLRSDNRTEVAIYHVGRLGSFDSRQLQLTPGDYTAVGHCDGYRDVRIEFSVAAGQSAGPITIRCEEKL